MKNEYKIIGIFVAFGLFIWIMNALFTSSSFPGITFWEAMSFDVPAQGMHAVVLIAASVIVFGIVIARLLSQRRRSEEALKESKGRYRHLFNELNDAVFLADVETGYIIDTNNRAEVLLGRAREEIIGMHQTELHPPEMTNGYRQRFAAHVEKGHIADYDGEVITNDGTIIPVNISAATVTIGGGKLILALFRDITGRKQAEEALRESRKRHLDLVNLLPQTIFELDERGNLTFANRQGTLAFGYTLEDTQKGLNALEFFIPEDRDKARKTIYRIMNGEQESGTNEYTAMRKDGSTFPVIVYSSAIVRENEPVGLRGVILDITERKQAEEALRESRKRFRDLVNLLPQTVWEIDTEGTFTFVNQAGFQYHGYTLEDLNVPLNTVQVFIPEDRDRMIENTRRILDGEELGGIEYMALRKDGSTFPVIVYGSPIIHGNETVGLRGVTVDITERKQAEEELRIYKNMVESAQDAIFFKDLESRYIVANKKTLEAFGLPREEVIGKNDYEIMPVQEEAEKNVEDDQLLFKTAKATEITKHMAGVDGKGYWFNAVKVPHVDDRGNITGLVGIARDITERKQAEEALRESEERYRTLFESKLDGVFVIDDTMKLLLANKAAADIFGFDYVEEALEANMLDFIVPEDRERAIRIITEDMFTNDLRQVNEFRCRKKSGEEIWVSAVGSLIEYQGKKAGLASFRDITERKQAEELFRTLASSSPVGIYIVQGGKWQFTNPRFQKYTGYSEDELLNMDSLSIVHNEDREGVRGNAVEMLKGNRLAPYEFRCTSKSGEAIWAMETVASIQYQGKRATLGSFMDVTEHKRMEEALRESEENLRAYLESAPDGVYLSDLKGTFLYGNKRAEEIIGYNREELIGSSFLELGLLTEDYLEKAGKLLELNAMGRSTGPDEFELVSRDGSRIWIEINTATIREKGEDIVIGFVRDITERKQMEEREKQLQEELLLSSRLASIGELAAGVAHEINNPLTGIMGYSQRLLRKSTDGEASRYLERIYSETKRVSRIVENLLTFARHHGPEKEYADINDILERTLELRSYELKTGNIDLEVELAPGLPRTMVDSQQTEQVFLNLILNAEQAMSGTNRVGKLSVKTQQVKRNIMVSFADNGPGILAEHIDRVFDPFFTTKEARSGTGLGLSLCHGIVTEHGGKIYARSKPGEGSSFFVELPVIPGKG